MNDLRRIRFALPAMRALLAMSGRAQTPAIPGLSAPVQRAASVLGPWPSAPVVVNEAALFNVYDDTRGAAQARADVVALRLEAATHHLGPGPLPSAVVRSSPQAVTLYLSGKPIITVSDADAQAAGKTKAEIADRWAARVNQAVRQAYIEQQPDFLRRAAIGAAVWLLIGVGLTLLLAWVRRRWLHGLNWPIFALLWGLMARGLIYTFPQTRFVDTFLWQGAPRPFLVIATMILAALSVARIWSELLKYAIPMDAARRSPEARAERVYRRRATLAAVARITGVTVIWILAVFLMLSRVGVNLPALVASAGIIGVGIGLATQDSMKDIVAGINILLDDRYGVGDTIDVGEYSGRVERLNLRVTQIRDMSGRLVTVPNRNIATVANETSRWSQVDFQVQVLYGTDLREAMKTLVDTAKRLKADWPERLPADPVMLGVDSFNDNSLTLRMTLKTTPGDQWAAARELRLRVHEAFQNAGIRMVLPQYTVTLNPEAPTGKAAE
jgi:small-conductance mechanosensitive channel